MSPAHHWAADLGLPGDVGIVARLVRLDLFLRRVLEDLTAAEGISVADYLVLAVVRRSPEHRATPGHISAVLDRTSGGMTLTLDRLARSGWVARTPDPDDRRRVVVTCTPAGLEVATRINAALHAWEDSLGLTETQQRETARAVDRLLERLAPT